MGIKWPHHYFKKHKRLPYLLIILIPALVYFVHQGQRFYESRQTIRELAAIKNSGQWYRYGADRNVKEAQYNLGLLYHRGFTVPRDDVEAAKWLRKASDQDLAVAENELGTYYEAGIGVAKNPSEAAKLYQRAADHGMSQAMNHLAGLLLTGDGVTQDKVVALKWFEKAATDGFIPAQINLALAYEHGDGIAADPILAYAWISVADAATDATVYQKPIDEIAARLMQSMDDPARLHAKGLAKIYVDQYGQKTREQFINILRQPVNDSSPSSRP